MGPLSSFLGNELDLAGQWFWETGGGKAVLRVAEEVADMKAQNCESSWHLGKMWVNTL